MPHVIDKITPNHGLVGQNVVITGSGFGALQGTSSVRFAPSEVASIVSWSNTSLTVTVPGTAVTGAVRVIVGGLDATSPRNADFWRKEEVTFPVSLVDLEAQNQKNDSTPEDLADADARDFNFLAELVLRIQKKVGIDGSADPTSLSNRISSLGSPQRLVIQDFEPVLAPIPIPLAVPDAGLLGLFRLQTFPDTVDRELLARFYVPHHAKTGGGELLKVFVSFAIDTPPAPGQAVKLDIFGEVNGVPIPSAPFTVVVSPFPTGVIIEVGPLLTIPIASALPDTPIALRLQALRSDGALDTYTGKFEVDSMQIEFEV